MKTPKLINIVIVGAFLTVVGAELWLSSSWLTIASAGVLVASCFFSKVMTRRQIATLLNTKAEKADPLNSLKKTFSNLNEGMEEAADMVANIGEKGDRNFEKLSVDHRLAQSIVAVDKKIKDFNQGEEKRKWQVEGIAKFSELLRSHDANIEVLCKKVISGLVRYISANQGSIFLHKKDEEEYLELTGCYAYDKDRVRSKKISIGQGLIGQCFLERETLFLLDIPQNYVSITSGLGEATPSNLVLVPLIVNEEIYGVMEFATFKPLEKYQIEFLEQVAENIASVAASLLNVEKTEKLLRASQDLTMELQSREEEMRQNMEELSATQEEMSRKQFELDGLVDAIDQTLGMTVIAPDGKIIKANSILAAVFGVSQEALTYRSYSDIIGQSDLSKDFLKCITHEQIAARDYQTKNAKGEPRWLNASFSPIKDGNGNTRKILALVRDITERKLEEIEFEKLSLVADNTNNSVIITDKNGLIEYVNHGFEEMTGYKEHEVLGKKPGAVLQGKETNQETIDRIRKALEQKVPVYEEILNYKKTGESYWISMAINPVFGEDGEIDKYISIQANITETKKSALDFSYKLKAISKSNAIIEFDTKGHILDVNDNFLKIVGYTKEELIGKHHKVFVTEQEQNSAEYEHFWKDLGKGKFVNKEFKRINKNGEVVWLRGIYNPIYDINGNPYKIVKFAIDITQEKALKAETHKQETELSNQMAAINKTIASASFDLEGNLLNANDIFTSITGLQLKSDRQLHYSDMVPAAELEKPQTELMWQNLREGKFFSGEFKMKDQTGKELWLSGTFNPIENVEGKPYKIMMYAQFTTSEKEKQKELSAMVNAFKNTAPIVELTPEGNFKNGNTMFFDEFGFKRLEMRQRPFAELLNEESTKINLVNIIKELKEQSHVVYDLNYKDAAGNSRSYQSSFTAITNLEDQIDKIVVILIDRKVVLKV